MRVTQGDRQGVRGVLGQRAGDVEQTFYHQLYLFLLRAAGADAIYPPGTVIPEAAEDMMTKLFERLGFAK